jgi:hypothetical protein
MIALFVGWLGYFFYTLYRFRRAHPRRLIIRRPQLLLQLH